MAWSGPHGEPTSGSQLSPSLSIYRVPDCHGWPCAPESTRVNPEISLRDDGGMGEAEGSATSVWVVWRQDDNGNLCEVARRESRAAAEELAAEFDARGH